MAKTPASVLPADLPQCQDEPVVAVPGEVYTVFVNEIEVRVMTTLEGAGFDVMVANPDLVQQTLQACWSLYRKGYLRRHGEERFIKH